jgi:predicted DNA binding CopG/RHH family protein
MRTIETPEEIEIIKAVENETYYPVEGQEKLKLEAMLKSAAKKTSERLSKQKKITLSLLESDIDRLKAVAMNEGMPYEVYIAHVIHKITTGQIRAL